jgi:hypothetical protein
MAAAASPGPVTEGTEMPPERGGPAAGNGQHYESFVVRVLLNDDGSIHDTRMEHIGTGEVKRWAGWEHDAILGFVKEAAAPAAASMLLAAPVEPAGELRARIVRFEPDRTLLRAGQPFAVTLGLDLSQAGPQNGQLTYSAVIVARQLGGRSGRTLAGPRGLLKAAGSTTITIAVGGLPPGVYLLEATVSLRAAGASHWGLAAMADGIMLQVLPS